MIYKQCKFKDYAAIDNDDDWIGGIAIIEDCGKVQLLHGVICGCCGSFIEADEIAEIEYFENWISISEEIIGN